MRKLIDIPDDKLEDLKINAVKAGKSLKAYIEDLINNDVKKTILCPKCGSDNITQLTNIHSYLCLNCSKSFRAMAKK